MKLEVSNKMANMFINAEVRIQDKVARLEDYKKGIAITICMERRNLTLTYESGTWWLDDHRD